MHSDRAGRQAKAFPDNSRFIPIGNVERVVNEFKPPQSRASDDGCSTEPSIDYFIAVKQPLYLVIEPALPHTPTQNEGISAIDPNQADIAQVMSEFRRSPEVVSEIQLGDIESEVTQGFRLL